ncbi:MAG TPA: cell division protein FtsQ/DivIB [Steroidobacteraceae bacterium]
MFGRSSKRNRRKNEGGALRKLSQRFAAALAHSAQSIISWCVLLGLVLVSVWIVTWMLDRPIAVVEVGGQFQRVAPVQIEEAVAPFRGAGFLSVDLEAMQSALEKLAWVDRARVERKWPNGVRVVITEHVPAARWGADGLMNTRGELFLRSARHIPPELPVLIGPEGTQAQVARLYLDTYPRLLAVGMRLTRVELDARGAWELTVDNNIVVRLGRQDVQERLERFIRVASPMVAARSNEISYVDLRYSNGFSVGWNQPPARVARDNGDNTPDA